MKKLFRIVRNSSIVLSAGVETLADKMSKRPRYFANPYQDIELRDNVNADHSRKRIRDDLKIILRKIVKHDAPEQADTEGGLYVGAAGIAYAFLRISQRPFLQPDEAKEYFSLAQRYLRASLNEVEQRGRRCNSGFLHGDAGVLAVGAVVAKISGDHDSAHELAKRYVETGERCTEVDFLKRGSDEFFVGRAGYLYGALWLNRELKETVVPVETMHEIARTVIKSGRCYARSNQSPCPLMYAYHGTEYLGAAHGLCAILQVLIQVPGFLDTDRDIESNVRSCVDYLLSLQTPSGNFPCALDEVDGTGRSRRRDELVHWCHGAPGVIYLMAAAYLRWKDQRYLNSCQRAGELVWAKGLLRKGPGICHGVAGSGYVFLLLYRLTRDELHLYRAIKFAEFLNSPEFMQEARTPDRPYSLYEGIAGTACYLADIVEPDKASFPFQDVF